LAAAIEGEVAGAKVELIKGGRGVFTVIADGKQVWNKHETGSFPKESEIVKRLTAG
jgi:selT/selW/selH-like putative selenoprotein